MSCVFMNCCNYESVMELLSITFNIFSVNDFKQMQTNEQSPSGTLTLFEACVHHVYCMFTTCEKPHDILLMKRCLEQADES